MTTVYIITRGCYSDYSIEAVYSTRELAEKYCEGSQGSYEKPGIEEWEIDAGVDLLRKGYRTYFVRMSQSGDILELEQRTFEPNPSLFLGSDIHNNFIMGITAQDEAHVIKIAGERRAAALAGAISERSSPIGW